jgi:hypothetical protein
MAAVVDIFDLLLSLRGIMRRVCFKTCFERKTNFALLLKFVRGVAVFSFVFTKSNWFWDDFKNLYSWI